MADPSDPAQNSEPEDFPPVTPQNPSVEVQVKADLQGEFVKKHFDVQDNNSRIQGMNFKVQVWLAIATTLAFVAAAIYAFIAHRQLSASNSQLKTMQDTLGEFQKQTKLMKQQLVGSQGALLTLTLGLTDKGELNVGLANDGHVNATNVHFELEVTPETISDERPLDKSISYEPTDIPPVKGGESWVRSWFLPWRPIQLSDKKEWPSNWPGNRTFLIRGKFSYQNGFGDEMRVDFCRKWLPAFTITTKAQSSGGGGLLPCDDFRTAIHSLLEQERAAEKEN